MFANWNDRLIWVSDRFEDSPRGLGGGLAGADPAGGFGDGVIDRTLSVGERTDGRLDPLIGRQALDVGFPGQNVSGLLDSFGLTLQGSESPLVVANQLQCHVDDLGSLGEQRLRFLFLAEQRGLRTRLFGGKPRIADLLDDEAGDIVVGDPDGVVIVPRAEIAAALARLKAVRASETKAVQGGLKEPGFMAAILASDRVRYIDG